jgi:hypothetical protein
MDCIWECVLISNAYLTGYHKRLKTKHYYSGPKRNEWHKYKTGPIWETVCVAGGERRGG